MLDSISCGFAIIVSLSCLAILFLQRSGREQRNLSFAFFSVLLFQVGYTLSVIYDEFGAYAPGSVLQYFGGLAILFLSVFVLASEFSVEVPKWAVICLSLFLLIQTVIIILFNLETPYVVFIVCAVLNSVFLIADCLVLRYKLKREKIPSARKNAKLLFVLMFIPQIVLFIHLWVFYGRNPWCVANVLLALAQIAITVFSMRDHFVPFSDIAYQSVVDSLEDPVFVLDMEENVVRVNKGGCSLFEECTPALNPPYFAPLPHLLEQIYLDHVNKVTHDDIRYVYVNWNVYEPFVSDIMHRNQTYGYVLRLHDVTQYHNANLKLSASNNKLQRDVANVRSLVDDMRSKAVSGIIQFLHEHDENSGEHMRRSSNYTLLLLRQMKEDGVYADELTDDYMEKLVQVAPLHDVGKFFVSEEILKKPDQLTPHEYEAVKSHVSLGAQMIDRMMVTGDDLYYQIAKDVALYHHEWWDGSGYLSGLRGESIPLAARVVSVSTVFDLVSTNRPFQSAASFDEAFDIIVASSGTQFDPKIIQSFINAKEAFRSAYTQMVKLS